MSALELAMPLLIVLGGLVPLWSRQQQRRRLQRRLASAAEAVPGHRLRAPRRDEAIVIAAFAGGGVFGAWLALPWWVVPADDKKKARLNSITHLLSQLPYQEVERPEVVLPPRVRHEDYVRHPVPDSMIVPQVF